MLKFLNIENIALIEKEQIEFFDGLNVLSGETGAGKSIIINALSFALGARADKTLIRSGANFALVSAFFVVPISDDLIKIFSEYNIEAEENIIITRKMFVDGKSDIRVNGVPISLSMLKNLTALLIDIYGQFEHTSLLDVKKHLQVLDEYGGESIQKKLDAFQKEYKVYNNLLKELENFGGNERDRANRIDYLEYQIAGIKSINPQIDEDKELQNKKNIMTNAEKLAECYNETLNVLDVAECSARNQIGVARNKMQIAENIDINLQEYSKRLYSLEAELDDIVSSLNHLCNCCEYDEYQLREVDERLDNIKSLKRKYGDSIEKVLDELVKLENELQKLLNSENEINNIKNLISLSKDKLYGLASELSSERKSIANHLEAKVLLQLKDLKMDKAQFEIAFREIGINNFGTDEVEFMFSANLGEPTKSLNKIISGGELSRFMLALKTVFAKVNSIDTQIYDEIDAGISGHIGQAIAKKLCQISKNCQVITISHLPQIVAMADTLYKIDKFEKDGKTYSKIEIVDFENSLNEIARLSGGENIGKHALIYAKEMKDWATKTKMEL